MLQLFSRNKENGSVQPVHGSELAQTKGKYFIQLDAKGKILFISFALKEYFLIYDIYDVEKMLSYKYQSYVNPYQNPVPQKL